MNYAPQAPSPFVITNSTIMVDNLLASGRPSRVIAITDEPMDGGGILTIPAYLPPFELVAEYLDAQERYNGNVADQVFRDQYMAYLQSNNTVVLNSALLVATGLLTGKQVLLYFPKDEWDSFNLIPEVLMAFFQEKLQSKVPIENMNLGYSDDAYAIYPDMGAGFDALIWLQQSNNISYENFIALFNRAQASQAFIQNILYSQQPMLMARYGDRLSFEDANRIAKDTYEASLRGTRPSMFVRS